MATDRLAAAVDALAPPWQGHYYAALESTQDEARAAGRVGAPDRSIYVSDYQRSGRGRQGRTWLAAPGTALLLSILFRDTDVAPRPWRWTSLASVALVEATDELLVTKKAAIKWPNDVMLDDRKVAGILAENTWDGRQLLAIVGVGVNVNTPSADLAALRSPAISIEVASSATRTLCPSVFSSLASTAAARARIVSTCSISVPTLISNSSVASTMVRSDCPLTRSMANDQKASPTASSMTT